MFYSMEIGGGYPGQCKTGNFGSLCRKGKHREFCYKAGKVGNTGKIFWLWSPIWKVHAFIYFDKFQKKIIEIHFHTFWSVY